MKIIKNIIQYLITIILIITMLAYFLIILVSNTILNKEYTLSKIENADYYSKIYENIKSNFENYIHQSGFEETILENIVTKEKIRNDTQIIIDNLYNGTNKEISTQEIKDNLNKNILETLENKKLNITQQNAINTFVEHICDEYTQTISHFKLESQVNQIYQKVIKYINIAKKIIIITIILAILLLFVINLKSIYRFISLIGISLTSTGIFLVIINLFVEFKIKIQTILILNNAISDILRNVLTEILNIITNGGLVLLISGILLIFLSNLVHNIKECKNKRKH